LSKWRIFATNYRLQAQNLKPEWTSWKGAKYSSSDSGWMRTANFIHWLDDILCPFARDLAPEDYEGPLFLILDEHTSHVSIDVIKAARDNDMEF
jgi:hypothetical protein